MFTNRDKVYLHLRKYGSITPAEALIVYKIQRLAPRIRELRQSGIPIRTVNRRDETGTPYAHYELSGLGGQQA